MKGTADLKSVARAYVANAPGPTAYSMLAESYAVRAGFDSALQICATGLERFPEDPWLRVQRGNIFLTTFSFSAAETEYSFLTGREESYEQQTNGHLRLQVVAIAGGRYRSAMRSVETLIDLARAEKDTAGMAFWSMEKARMHVLFFRDAEAGKAAGHTVEHQVDLPEVAPAAGP